MPTRDAVALAALAAILFFAATRAPNVIERVVLELGCPTMDTRQVTSDMRTQCYVYGLFGRVVRGMPV